MARPRSRLTAIAIAVGVAMSATDCLAAENDPAWTIAPRTIPPPVDVSGPLRSMIAAARPPDVAGARASAPRTTADWAELIAKRRQKLGADGLALAKKLSVAVRGDRIEGVAVYHLVPEAVAGGHGHHLFVFLHGGAYVFGSGEEGLLEGVMLAARLKMPVLAIDYRMPPEHPFPAAVDDVLTVYRHLLSGRPARSIAMGGTSAGGGLAMAAVHRFLAVGLEVPGAVYAGSPWADLTKTGDSMHALEGIDRVLVTYEKVLEGAARLYAGRHALEEPEISPVYGRFTGFPPTYLVTGTRDMFLSDTARVHRKLRAAGVCADLHVYEGMSHGEYLAPPYDFPESLDIFSGLDAFLGEHLSPDVARPAPAAP
jgi:monoterpene epsilon-lactone hydrolase